MILGGIFVIFVSAWLIEAVVEMIVERQVCCNSWDGDIWRRGWLYVDYLLVRIPSVGHCGFMPYNEIIAVHNQGHCS